MTVIDSFYTPSDIDCSMRISTVSLLTLSQSFYFFPPSCAFMSSTCYYFKQLFYEYSEVLVYNPVMSMAKINILFYKFIYFFLRLIDNMQDRSIIFLSLKTFLFFSFFLSIIHSIYLFINVSNFF
jgi:hypothetical protein